MVNERIFDIMTEESSYLLGAFHACCLPLRERGLVFRSSSKKLVEFVKAALDSDHSIISDPRGKNSHFITIGKVPFLRRELFFIGVTEPKPRREFPDIPPGYMDHFVRGFLDGINNSCTPRGLNVSFSSGCFIKDLHNVLVDYADIKPLRSVNSHMMLKDESVVNLRDFIYSDWEIIHDLGIYVPSKKSALESYVPDIKTNYLEEQHRRKMNRLRSWILQGRTMEDILDGFGYSHKSAVSRAYVKQFGETISDTRKNNGCRPQHITEKGCREKVSRGLKALSDGASIDEATEAAGYNHKQSFYSACRRLHGKPPTKYKEILDPDKE